MRLTIPLALLVVLASAASAQQRVYVDADAPPDGDGASWATAFRDLQDGLEAAGAMDAPVEVWVAAGTYRPDRGTLDRTASFPLASGVAVYGGFAGTESELSQRDPAAHETILSGDLLGNDAPGFVHNDENAEHVVMASGVGETAVLDGFTVRAGNSNVEGDDGYGLGGAAIYGFEAGPTIVGCRFEANSAGHVGDPNGRFAGGAVSLGNKDVPVHPRVERCVFIGNRAVNAGALAFSNSDRVIYQEFTEFSLDVVGCQFIDNHADLQVAGALSVGASPFNTDVPQNLHIEDCLFQDNHAAYGGAVVVSNALEFTMTDCELIGNAADVYAGCLWHMQTAQTDVFPAQIVGCTFEDNFVARSGGAIRLESAAADIVGCSFLGNNAIAGAGVLTLGYAFGCGNSLTIVNSVFSGNTASSGAGVYVDCSPHVVIVNSTFSENLAGQGGAGAFIDAANAQIANSVFWGNSNGHSQDEAAQLLHTSRGSIGLQYSLVQNLTGSLGGVGNIDADPMFVDAEGADGVAGTADDDVRLGAGSPAIDAADNTRVPADSVDLDGDGDTGEATPLDRDGRARFTDDAGVADTGVPGNGHDQIVDMGAYEGAPCGADFDGSGAVDTLDVLAFLNAWNAGDHRADFNGDGSIDTLDVLAFLNAWGRGC